MLPQLTLATAALLLAVGCVSVRPDDPGAAHRHPGPASGSRSPALPTGAAQHDRFPSAEESPRPGRSESSHSGGRAAPDAGGDDERTPADASPRRRVPSAHRAGATPARPSTAPPTPAAPREPTAPRRARRPHEGAALCAWARESGMDPDLVRKCRRQMER
jgi:hypothetical protein